jgi:hypothetical protein
MQTLRQLRNATRARRREQQIRLSLSCALRLTATVTGAPWDEIGVHAFLLNRRPSRRLVNVGGLRLGVSVRS